MTNYGKLIDNVFTIYNGEPVEYGNMVTTNPKSEHLLQAGFKPVENNLVAEVEGYSLVPVYTQDDEKIYITYDYVEIPTDSEPTAEELAEVERITQEQEQQQRLALISERENSFNRNFFNTSLGYVRRKVTMADGSTADFLKDLLPVIALGVNSGQVVTILTYDRPQSFENEVDFVTLQHSETVTSQFLQECFLQVANDFTGGANVTA